VADYMATAKHAMGARAGASGQIWHLAYHRRRQGTVGFFHVGRIRDMPDLIGF
jgi:hypothetical protein